MASVKQPIPPAAYVVLYDRLLAAANPPIERKGAASPYTSLNGHMFSFLSASGILALRLPAQTRERFLCDHGAALFIGPHGKPMAEFVAVPAALLEDTAAMTPWMEIARAYVAGQRPKPTTRGKAAAGKP